MIQGSFYVRWQQCCLEAVFRAAYTVTWCYAALRSFLLEIIFLAMLNRIDANSQSGLEGPMYKGAISELYLVQISRWLVHMVTIKHTLLFQLH